MDRQACQHRHEEDPKNGKHTNARLADDLGNDTKDGQGDHDNNPLKDQDEPPIDAFNTPRDHHNDSTRLV